MAKIVIFGTQDFAQLAHFYFKNDTEHEVVAFTLDKKYMSATELMGLPVVDFETVQLIYPPSEYQLFVPMSPTKMNVIRAEKYNEAKNKGYELISYVSSKATYYGSPVGDNCFIFENNVIQPFTEIGNNVIMWSGNHIGHHSVIKSHCFIASHAVVSGHVTIDEHCFLGVNATIKDNVYLAKHTFVGAGALILDNTVEYGVYPGIKAEVSKVPSNKLR